MSEWRETTLGQLVHNFDSLRKPVKSSDRSSGEFPYYGASGIIDWVDGYTHNGEYLLIAEDGENLRSRSSPIAFMARGKSWVNNHAHAVTGNDLADTRFLEYLLAKTDVTGYLTGSAQPKLSKSSLDSIKLRVPPLRLQTAIAEVLGALDDKIAANTAVGETLIQLAETHFRQIMNAETDEQKLGDVLSLEYGKSLPSSRRSPGSIDVYGSGGITGVHNDALCSLPGVIIGRKGTAGAVHWSHKPFFPIDTTFYVAPTHPSVSQIFCYFLLKTIRLDEMNNDSAVPGLNRNQAHASRVTLPSITAIEDFTSLTSKLFGKAAQTNSEQEILRCTRDALLPQLMSGKLRVKDAEAVVSAAV